jgi:hypothetical protein
MMQIMARRAAIDSAGGCIESSQLLPDNGFLEASGGRYLIRVLYGGAEVRELEYLAIGRQEAPFSTG